MSPSQQLLLGALIATSGVTAAAIFIRWRRRVNLLNFKANLLLDSILGDIAHEDAKEDADVSGK